MLAKATLLVLILYCLNGRLRHHPLLVVDAFKPHHVLPARFTRTSSCYRGPSYSAAFLITIKGGAARREHKQLAMMMIPAEQVVVSAMIALPSVPTIGLACLLPTLSGYYRKEYTVSYSYGAAIALSAGLVLKALLAASVPRTSIAAVHALALLFYGVRLDLFLLYREVFVERFRTKQAEPDSVIERLSQRTPFILGCAVLYGFMVAPLLATSNPTNSIIPNTAFWSIKGGLLTNLLRALVGTCWFGFVLAAWGDAQKSWAKAKLGEDALVTTGVYQYCRHPNYTGEIIGWTASALAALITAIPSGGGLVWNWPVLVASGLGGAGICGVLVQATTTLEQRQKAKYGTRPDYQKWVDSSWAGFTKKQTTE